MRISDWSSDVCSSDLVRATGCEAEAQGEGCCGDSGATDGGGVLHGPAFRWWLLVGSDSELMSGWIGHQRTEMTISWMPLDPAGNGVARTGVCTSPSAPMARTASM